MFGAKDNSKTTKADKIKPPKVAAQEIVKDCDKFGYMSKQGGSFKSWHKRFIILHQGNLYYYKTKTDKQPKGMIPILGLRCDRATIDKAVGIKIISPSRTYYMLCSSEAEVAEWIQSINDAAAYNVKQLVHVVAPKDAEDSDTKFSTIPDALQAKELSNNDQIALRPGEYTITTPVQITVNVELQGIHPDPSYIHLAGDMPQPLLVIQCKNTVKICHCSLTNTKGDCIHIKGGHVIIEDCSLTSLQASSIVVSGNATCTVVNSQITENLVSGIIVQDKAELHAKGSNFVKNKVGITVTGEAQCTVEDCKLVENTDAALVTDSKQVAKLKGSVLKNNNKNYKMNNGATCELTSNKME